MTVTINAVTSTGLVQTSDGSGIVKLQSNGVTTNALAWVNFAGASGTRNANYNVSSVTRNSTGNYTINFSNALSDSNYVVVIGGNRSAGSATDNLSTSFWSPSTSSVSVSTAGPVSVSYYDANIVSVAIFGN